MSYGSFWRGILAELDELPTASERSAAKALLDRVGLVLWTENQPSEWKDAAAHLEMTPATFRKRWEKIPKDQRPLMWLRLRYLAHLSANAAAIAESVEMVTGLGYRKALRSVAEQLLHHQLEPTEGDLLG